MTTTRAKRRRSTPRRRPRSAPRPASCTCRPSAPKPPAWPRSRPGNDRPTSRYLAEVLAAEVDDRTERRRTRRINDAKFPRLKRLADFNVDAVPTIQPATLGQLAAGHYMDAGEPVVLLGDSGTGKSHLLIGLGLAACEQGRRVRYVTTAQLVNELVEAADERVLSRVVGRYGRLDLLCLDELGYVQIDPRGAELLFQIITEREERASIAIATNLPFSEWGTRVPRPPPGRRHRRPRHLQRPHPRNRHPVLPAAHQQDHRPTQARQLTSGHKQGSRPRNQPLAAVLASTGAGRLVLAPSLLQPVDDVLLAG